MKLAGYRLVDRYSTRDTAQGVAVNYAPSKIVKRREKWEVWTKQGRNKRNLFGFGKKVTHSTKLSSQAFEAGKRSGDTGQFRSWWDSQTSKSDEKFSSKLKRHAEQRYRAGVHSLWEQREKQEAKATQAEAKEDAKTVQADVVEALIGQQFTKSAARAAVKRHYKSGDTFDSLFRKTIGSGKTSKMTSNRKKRKGASNAKRGLKTTRRNYALYQGPPQVGERWYYSYRARKAGKWRTLFATSTIAAISHPSSNTTRYKFSDGRTVDHFEGGDEGLVSPRPNPAKFDRCVADVKKSLKKYKRPGNAYAICTKAGTRNPSFKYSGGLTHPAAIRMAAKLRTEDRKLKARGGSGTGYGNVTVQKEFEGPGKTTYAVYVARNPARSAKNPAYYVVDEQYKMIVVHSGPYGSAAKADMVAKKKSSRFEAMSYTELRNKEEAGYDVHRYSGSKQWWGRSNPSARARAKATHRHRTARQAAKTKRSVNARVVWSAHQGKLTAQVTRSLSGYRVKLFGGKRVFEEIPARHFDEAVSIARLRLADTSAQNPKDDVVIQALPGVSQADAIVTAGHRVLKGVRKAAKKTTRGLLKRFKGRRSKNPIDSAQKMYEEFHGEPSKEVLEIVEESHHHSVVAAIGQLVSLLVEFPNGKTIPLNAPGFSEKVSNGRKFWEFDEKTPLIKRVLVTTSEDGKQLFLDGGDQAISNDELKKLGFTDRDIHDHMVLGRIKMITYRTRKSFEAKGKESIDFWHVFGSRSEGSGGVLPTLLYYPRSKKLKIAGGRYYIAPPDRSLGNVSPGIEG